MTQKKQALVWLSFARSGTNYLTNLLSFYKNIDSYREVFQSGGVHIYNNRVDHSETLRKLRLLSVSLLGKDQKIEFRDQELIDHFHTWPSESLNALLKQAETDYISLKIFQKDLPFETLEKEVLSNHSTRNFLWVRNPLDTYISWVKYRISRKANRFDSTSIKPALCAVEYKKFLEERKTWLCFLNQNKAQMEGYLSYDKFVQLGSEEKRLKFLTDVFKKIGLKVNLDPGFQVEDVKIVKQDQEEVWENKIANPNRFKKACFQADFNPLEDLVSIEIPSLI